MIEIMSGVFPQPSELSKLCAYCVCKGVCICNIMINMIYIYICIFYVYTYI